MAFGGDVQFYAGGVPSERGLIDAAAMNEIRKDFSIEVEPDVFYKVRIAKVNASAKVVRIHLAAPKTKLKNLEEAAGYVDLTLDQKVVLKDGETAPAGKLPVGAVLKGVSLESFDPEAPSDPILWEVVSFVPQPEEVPVYGPTAPWGLKRLASQFVILAYDYPEE